MSERSRCINGDLECQLAVSKQKIRILRISLAPEEYNDPSAIGQIESQKTDRYC